MYTRRSSKDGCTAHRLLHEQQNSGLVPAQSLWLIIIRCGKSMKYLQGWCYVNYLASAIHTVCDVGRAAEYGKRPGRE